jgi:hypothetical protein
MKHLTLLLIAAFCFALGPTTSALAQGRRGGAGGAGGARSGGGLRSGAGQADEENTILLLSTFLDLSDAQTQMVRGIFDTALLTAAPLAKELEAGNQSLYDAAKSGQSADQIASLAQQQGPRETQMEVLQAQTFSKVLAILTMDQKSQADAFIYGSIGRFLSNPQPLALPSLPVPPGAVALPNPAALPPPGALGAPNPATPAPAR